MYERDFLFSLALTIIIEFFALWAVLRIFFKAKQEEVPFRLILFTGFFNSFATLPYVWFIIPFFIRDFFPYAVTSELFALGLETVFYYFILKTSWRRSFLLSLICNSCSFLFGQLWHAVFKA